MLFERFEVKGLAHYSYAVGCPGVGQFAVIDPERNIEIYLDFARKQGLRISHIFETHIHADYASGARELAAKTGAKLMVSGYDKDETFEVQFEHKDMFDGDEVDLGSVRIEAVHTPGHTPEHLSFLVYDLSRSRTVPMMLLSGDFLFVGSLGRPDLLGEEEKRALANSLYESAREKITSLPDSLEVYPAHGAGSMCGSGMSGRPTSTLGFERIANPYLNEKLSREGFVEQILGTVPPFPDYYRKMKALNSEGPRLLDGLPGREALDPAAFQGHIEAGAVVIDLRDQLAFGGGHIPESFGIGASPSLATWASWVMPYDRPILLAPASPDQVDDAIRCLIRVGLDNIVGHLEGGITAWREAGLPLAETPQLSVLQLQQRLEQGSELHVVDVRSESEWDSGHIEGAHHLMAGYVEQQRDSLPDGPIAIVCGSGYRSTVVASVLERHSHDEVFNVTGGMGAWKKAMLPFVTS